MPRLNDPPRVLGGGDDDDFQPLKGASQTSKWRWTEIMAVTILDGGQRMRKPRKGMINPPLAVYPPGSWDSDRGELWTVCAVNDGGWRLLNMPSETLATQFADTLLQGRGAAVALSKPTKDEMIATMPEWVEPWVKACREARKVLPLPKEAR